MSDDELDNKIELAIRKYFDHFLKEILPEILVQHERSCAHGRELTRLRYICIGIAVGLSVCIPQIFELVSKFF